MLRLRDTIQTASYINIHTHHPLGSKDCFELINLIPLQGMEISTDCWYSCGLHPWHITEDTLSDSFKQIEEFSGKEPVIALGETGLDKSCYTPFDIQLKVFEWHIKLAEFLRKPLVIHCVKAWSEMISLRKKNCSIPWIFHAFNANIEIAEELIGSGCYLSFGKSLFKDDTKAFRTLSDLNSLQNVFLETDDEKNLFIEDIYQKVSVIRDVEMCSISKGMKDNFSNCFSQQ